MADRYFRSDLPGAFHARARFYSPHLGRFLTPDPNETALPAATALAFNAANVGVLLTAFDALTHYADGLNRYAAYGANPLTRLPGAP